MLVLKMSSNGDSAHVAGLSRCVAGIDTCVDRCVKVDIQHCVLL